MSTTFKKEIKKYRGKTGIYAFTNRINGKMYIGQSVDIGKRLRNHINDYKANRYNLNIYKAYKKYGIENFDFDIIEYCNKNELGRKEVYWIFYYDTLSNGYNMQPGGEGIGSGKYNPNYNSHYNIKHYFEHLDGTIEYLSPRELAEKYNLSLDIYGVAQGKFRFSQNWGLKGWDKSDFKKYPFEYIDGTVEYLNTSELVSKYNLSDAHIRDVVKGERAHSHCWGLKGWDKYKYKKRYFEHIDGTVKYLTPIELMNKYNLYRDIYRVIKGKRNHSQGWRLMKSVGVE